MEKRDDGREGVTWGMDLHGGPDVQHDEEADAPEGVWWA